MTVLLVVVCAVAAEAAPGTDARSGSAQADLLQQVESALKAEPALWRHHCGYLAYLVQHPELAPHENVFSDLCTLTPFRQAVGDFDEALARDAASQSLFDRYYEALAKDDNLRLQMDALFRLELSPGHDRAVAPPLVEYFRREPDNAIFLLQSSSRPSKSGLPSELRRALPYLKGKPELQQRLLHRFVSLRGTPLADTQVFPWWQAIAGGDSETAKAYNRLETYLTEHPNQFWIWHRREIALASNPHVRDWVRYWRRAVRRDPVLAVGYDTYLRRLRETPELLRQTLQGTAQDKETCSTWPPSQEQPPPLAPLDGTSGTPRWLLKEDLKPVAPEKPAIARPSRPAMPRMPNRPQKLPKPKDSPLPDSPANPAYSGPRSMAP